MEATVGFVRSAAADVATRYTSDSGTAATAQDEKSKSDQWDESVTGLETFLKESGMEKELEKAMSSRLYDNIVILGKIQEMDLMEDGRRSEAALPFNEDPKTLPSRDEAARYMKFATSVYGPDMITAAEREAEGKRETRYYPEVKTKILEHTGIAEEHLRRMDVEYGGSMDCLRHIVAVDHSSKAVVLAIRGTLSLSGLIIDITGYAEQFCGGEAHAGMAKMARAVWDKAGPSVVAELNSLPKDYGLVITGHSLGAGTACLITIMCYHDHLVPIGRSVRCFAYASPPVFSPITAAPEAVRNTTNYINENDVVPFLSVDSVRRIFAVLGALEEKTSNMSWADRKLIVYGQREPSPEFIDAFRESSSEELVPIEGAPPLAIPALYVVWGRRDEEGKYDYKVCDPVKVAKLGVFVCDTMINDHHPPQYEYAFENVAADSPISLEGDVGGEKSDLKSGSRLM